MNIFIGCGKSKKSSRCKAKDLYIGNVFTAAWGYAMTLTGGKESGVYILSGKHHLLKPDTEIDPYNVYISDMSAEKREEWAEEVLKEMKAAHIDFGAKTYFLAGEDYTEHLIEHFSNAVDVYGKKSGMGYIIQYLQKHTADKYKKDESANESKGLKGLYRYVMEFLTDSVDN